MQEIRSVAADALRRADVDQQLPTPVDDIVAAAGLTDTDEYLLTDSKISQAPKALRRLLRSAARKTRGILDRRERVVHVDPGIKAGGRRDFIRLHETFHDAAQWQRDLILVDNDLTLAPSIELRFEREANQGAAEMFFQLDLLRIVASDYPVDISTPVELSAMFGASIHATFRRWIEQHAEPLCGLVLAPDIVRMSPLTFRRQEVIESSTWSSRFGPSQFPQFVTAAAYPFVSLLGPAAGGFIDSVADFSDANGIRSPVRVQSFNNHYRTFLLLSAEGRGSFVARHRKKATLQR